ncbi:DUF599 domain-containing protein [Roseovarius sp. 217]|uniref:DUF599 domain-containing protein n=1 Tax=Roseovarius sp. (strain 217) TaxID=314264 RepID=UPI0000685612|nr:DUF599 domain-containing protein [Roseovarius sp. 217]EAQ24378.1 hypothetical protein ROS217_09010 [Roseovarius sp. 217]
MIWMDQLTHFNGLDAVALGALVGGWLLLGLMIENPPRKRPSVTALMAQYRREWMVQMVARDARIFDAQLLASLRQGTAFFASATLIAIGGALAMLGDLDRVMGIADDLTPATVPVIVWEVKILVILIFLTNAFLKFVWSNRLFGYCAVIMAAVPNDPTDPAALPRARKAAEINITAARGFNRGLRAIYFALTAAAWLLGPIALIGGTTVTCLVLLRREFASQSRVVLMQPDVTDRHTQT